MRTVKNTPEDHITKKGKREFSLIQQLFHHRKKRKKAIKKLVGKAEQDTNPQGDLVSAVNHFMLTGPLQRYRTSLRNMMVAWLDQSRNKVDINEMKHN